MPDEKYFALDAVSASFLKTCASQSLLHAHADALVPRKPTPAMALGSALHARVLLPDEPCTLADGPLFAANNATARERRESLDGMIAALRDNREARKYLDAQGSATEMSILWTEGGLPAKAKLDVIGGGPVVDLKSARDASDRGFSRAVFGDYRYDIQAAWYLRAARAAGYTPDGFIFVVVESLPPHAVKCHRIDELAIEAADAEIDRLLPRIKAARESGIWPGYGDETNTLYLPAWRIAE